MKLIYWYRKHGISDYGRHYKEADYTGTGDYWGGSVCSGKRTRKEQFGIQVTDSNKEVVDKAEVIVLSVKPQFYEDVINEIKGDIKDEQIIITIAPGKTLAWLAEKFNRILRSCVLCRARLQW